MEESRDITLWDLFLELDDIDFLKIKYNSGNYDISFEEFIDDVSSKLKSEKLKDHQDILFDDNLW